MKGKIFVGIQFVCLLVLILLADWFHMPWWSYALLFCSLGLAFWAIRTMRPGNFNIEPKPVEQGVFINTGPYQYIRHPMYLSIFLAEAGILSHNFSFLIIVTSIILTTNLILKLHYEERLLLAHYTHYKAYRLKTKKLIPFIW